MATDSNRLDRLEALAERLLEIAQQQQMQSIRHEGEIEDLKQATADLRASTADVVSMIGTLANQQSEISADVRGLQLESRRILDYLFRQQGGEPPEG
jgi:pyridoxine/pyridoxamine 5'-phosphate oxidase